MKNAKSFVLSAIATVIKIIYFIFKSYYIFILYSFYAKNSFTIILVRVKEIRLFKQIIIHNCFVFKTLLPYSIRLI